MTADDNDTTDPDEVVVMAHDAVMVVTINRPHAKNAVTGAVAERVATAMDELDRREDLRVGIITGAAGTFCAGMDLKAFLRGERPTIDGRGFGGLTESPPDKPLIAAVEGYALAGGCELVLASDLVVAADGAQFGLPEVKRGLVAAAGGLLRLPHRIPPQIAMEMALTGDRLTAQRAYETGLVNAISEDGAALADAMDLAQRIVANGPLATTATKRILLEHEQWPEADRFRRQREITDPVFRSEDAHEGARAFKEKRRPQWQGR